MQGQGKMLIIIGLVLVVAGLLISYGSKIPFLGKLPGDFLIKRENFTIYFPLATSFILSLILSIIFWLLRK